MNTHVSKGKWREIKDMIREQWGDITDDELEKTKGSINQIAGRIQRKYGQSITSVRRKLNQFLGQINC